MFTGIVEEIGIVHRLQHKVQGIELSIASKKVHVGAQPGDSMAVNGTCLTVTGLTEQGFTVALSSETRKRTNLASVRQGGLVNLERSLLPTSRIGGHFVQGHIDGTGVVASLCKEPDALWVNVCAPKGLMRYIVPKGFIAVDGASLTVVNTFEETFTVCLIAYTRRQITLPVKKIGDKVNLEVDVLGKYIEKMLFAGGLPVAARGISTQFLVENGYGLEE
ncbi:MAG: riboflavin synthase [Chloroflexota bacterium]